MSDKLELVEGAQMKAGDSSALVKRENSGRFKKGNPGGPGRPKMDPKVRRMLEAKTKHAAKRLVEALDAKRVVHHEGKVVGTYVDHEMRVRAAEALLNRLYGKPPQNAQIDFDDGTPVVNGVRVGVIVLPPPQDDGGDQ
jgi:hypothetical protein